MEEKKEHNCIFDEKKKTARILRYVYIAAAVVYVGLLIWSLCRQNYVAALFDVALLLMDISYVFWCNSSISDAELALEYMEIRDYPWIRVDERLPEEDPHNKGTSVGVIILFPSDRVSIGYYSFKNRIWFIPRFLGSVNPIYWMPMPKVNP